MLGDIVIAEALDEETIHIEGNAYFPLHAVKREFLEESSTPYTCPWKGECQYYDVVVGGESLKDRAWSYPTPYSSAVDRVGEDFSGHVAFWKEIEVV